MSDYRRLETPGQEDQLIRAQVERQDLVLDEVETERDAYARSLKPLNNEEFFEAMRQYDEDTRR